MVLSHHYQNKNKKIEFLITVMAGRKGKKYLI